MDVNVILNEVKNPISFSRRGINFNLKSSIFIFCVLCVSSISAGTLDLIVIDPGHGGKDPGTIGVSGSKEKDINLSISLKLHRLISSSFPNVKVVLTRSSDEFIEVKDRSFFANSIGAKLFVSIHCNHKKEEETDKSGFEIYVLNRERLLEAIDITTNENNFLKPYRSSRDSVSNFILSTLAQNAFLKFSCSLASFLNINLQNSVSLSSRGIMQSGFWVLLGSSMPSVLLECGYLSDKNDESYLSSEPGQTAFAQSLFEGFSRFKLFYESFH